jgi:hypothetical protein
MDGVKALAVLASVYYPGDGVVAKNKYQTSSGQRYDQSAPKCAALQWPLGTMLHLVHGRNNIDVTINDHGPYRRGRALDCTPAVGQRLAPRRFRPGARRTLSAVAEGAASGGASTALLKMTVLPPTRPLGLPGPTHLSLLAGDESPDLGNMGGEGTQSRHR